MTQKLAAPKRGTRRAAIAILTSQGWTKKEVSKALRMKAGKVTDCLTQLRNEYPNRVDSLPT